jgi:putative membrane protein
MMRYGFGGMHMLGGWLIAAVIGLILLALAVLAVIVLVRLLRHTGRHGHWQAEQPKPAGEDNSSFKILDERFAKGEIDEEEYTRKKELLKKQ